MLENHVSPPGWDLPAAERPQHCALVYIIFFQLWVWPPPRNHSIVRLFYVMTILHLSSIFDGVDEMTYILVMFIMLYELFFSPQKLFFLVSIYEYAKVDKSQRYPAFLNPKLVSCLLSENWNQILVQYVRSKLFIYQLWALFLWWVVKFKVNCKFP